VVDTAVDAATAVAVAFVGEAGVRRWSMSDPQGRDGVDLTHELAALPWQPQIVLTSSTQPQAT
jgi:hypothetical protein